MQLGKKRKKKGISGRLASAACVLLGGANAAAEGPKEWEVDTSFLVYSEKDRVTVFEPSFSAKKTFDNSSILGLNFVFDTMTGASPNGASPSDGPQTFTRPSGNDAYTIEAGETPLDDTFKDTRIQLGASWDSVLTRLTRYRLGANVSSEYDYMSVSFNGGLSQELNQKNTVLSVGVAYAFDTSSPVGGVPVPLASMAAVGSPQPKDGESDSKSVTDFMLGLTQVLNARTLMQFNVGTSLNSGYLNDPYKIVSVVDGNGRPTDYLYENRPDSRIKNYFFWNTSYHIPNDDTIDLSYRYMFDDWGINSHTIDLRYRWNISEHWYLQPRVRWYQQSAADFYRHSIGNTEDLSVEMSADPRLAEFYATTIGAKVGYVFDGGSEISARLESYRQIGDKSPDDAVGVQKDLDMFPDLEAVMFLFSYNLVF